jgi:transposase
MPRVKTMDSKKNREKFLEEYAKEGATMETAANAAGLSVRTIFRYIEQGSDTDFIERKQAIEESNRMKRAEKIVKKAEEGLMELVEKKVPSAIYFALKTRGGWHEKQDVNVSGDLKVDIVYGDEQQ